MATQKKEEGKKTRRPSALKRDIQSERAKIRNRAYRAKVNSAMRSLKEAVEKKENTLVSSHVNTLYSLMDKGVKTGIYKLNKASRVKARISKMA